MTTNLILYILRAIAAIVLSAAAFVYVRKSFSGKTKSFFGGAGVYFIFYCLIYAVISTYLEMFTKVFDGISNDFYYNLINILLETLCVALGYFILFKVVIKKQYDNGIGLMSGVGFSSLLLLISRCLPSLVNVAISIMYIKNPEAGVLNIFEGNIYQISQATSVWFFYDLLEMIFLFCIETAIAVTFYRVHRCENRKIWLLAAVILRIGAYFSISLKGKLNEALSVIILAAIAVIACGMAYSLVKPFVRKPEE